MTSHPAVASNNLLTDNPEMYEAAFPDPDHDGGRFVADMVAWANAATGQVSTHDGAPSILDIGCGTGRDAGYLARNGFRVTGIDLSERMIEYARRTYPEATFLTGDMTSFALPWRVDVVTCLDSALLYCHSNAQLTSMLRHSRRHLRPGGLFIAEMRNGAHHLGTPLPAPSHRTVTWHGVDYQSRTELRIDHAAQLLRRRRTWTWPGGELVQHSAWRLLFPHELRYFLETAGFEVLDLFDAPGPRVSDDPPTNLSGYRLHVIARSTT